MDGQNWPSTGEVDVMESFDNFTFHIEYGPAGTTFGEAGFENPGGSGGDFVPGTHTFGVLDAEGVTFYYDGVKVSSETASAHRAHVSGRRELEPLSWGCTNTSHGHARLCPRVAGIPATKA